MIVTRFEKSFEITNGKWTIGNLYDKLTSSAFDKFMNMHRKAMKPRVARSRDNLKRHNYQYKEVDAYGNYKN